MESPTDIEKNEMYAIYKDGKHVGNIYNRRIATLIRRAMATT